jgi:hypothetical protein
LHETCIQGPFGVRIEEMESQKEYVHEVFFVSGG